MGSYPVYRSLSSFLMFNPSKTLFLITLTIGTLISVSATSWFGAWIGLEINLISFIPLMITHRNILRSEASLKYFLVQALASSILLFSVIIIHLNDIILTSNQFILLIILCSSLLLKIGAAPLHFWFPGTMEGLTWRNCFILITWQKIAPLILLSYIFNPPSFILLIIISSILIGSLGGLNQTSLRKLIAYSSINHIGWILAAIITGENIWIIYFLFYSFLSGSIIFILHSFQIFHINQRFVILTNNPMLKFLLFTLLLSLGGLPPFLGFLPKWLIIHELIIIGQPFITTIIVITTLITLLYYLRLTFSAFLLSYSEAKWNYTLQYNTSTFITLITLSLISLLGLLLCTAIFIII